MLVVTICAARLSYTAPVHPAVNVYLSLFRDRESKAEKETIYSTSSEVRVSNTLLPDDHCSHVKKKQKTPAQILTL